MNSDSTRGHSEEIMVAQPVDTIPLVAPASVRDSMSPASGSIAKETQQMDTMSDTFLSEDSPEKQEPKVR